MRGCLVSLLSLVLSGGNDHDVEVGPGQLPLGLEVHLVQVNTIGEQSGQTSVGLNHIPDSFHEIQAVFHHGLPFQHYVSWVPAQVVFQGLAHNTSG